MKPATLLPIGLLFIASHLCAAGFDKEAVSAAIEVYEHGRQLTPQQVMLLKEADLPGFGDNPVIDYQGGPDDFGYIYRDSEEPDGPVFHWVDISGTGTNIALHWAMMPCRDLIRSASPSTITASATPSSGFIPTAASASPTWEPPSVTATPPCPVTGTAR